MQKFKFSKREKLSLALALIIFISLFISSSMTYHEQKMSSSTIKTYFGFLDPLLSHISINYGGQIHSASKDGLTNSTQFFVRKLAHFSSYFLLGLGLFAGLKRFFLNKVYAFIFIWPITISLAVFDEYHQYLTGDRTPSVHDVVLDSIGALCGILLFLIYRLFIEKSAKKAIKN